MKLAACGKAAHQIHDGVQGNAQTFPLVGDLNGDAVVGRRFGFEYQGAEPREIPSRLFVAGKRLDQLKERGALVLAAPGQLGAAVNALRQHAGATTAL